MKETLGQRIKNARRSAEMTQEALANAVHVSRQTVSLWENDKTQPDLETLRFVAETLNTTLAALLDEAQEDEAPSEMEEACEQPAPLAAKEKRRQVLFLIACLCVVLVCGVIVAVRFAAPKQQTYDPEWFQAESAVVPGQASILMYTHENPIPAWQRAQNAKPDWIFHLYFREQGGIGFTPAPQQTEG